MTKSKLAIGITVIFVFILAGIGTRAAVARFVSNAPPAGAAPLEAVSMEYQKKIEVIAADMGRLSVLRDIAEDMHDPKKYMEASAALAKKNLEADILQEEFRRIEGTENSRKGFEEGLQQGMGEIWRKPFNYEEKLSMLAEKHRLSPEEVNLIKSEIEILFSEELAEKFQLEPEPSDPDASSAP